MGGVPYIYIYIYYNIDIIKYYYIILYYIISLAANPTQSCGVGAGASSCIFWVRSPSDCMENAHIYERVNAKTRTMQVFVNM